MTRGRTMIGRVLGHYRVLEPLGEGGMGVVYRAEDLHLERDVALKVLPPGALDDPRARKHLRTEADALARLSHPNIATVFDFDTQEDVDFLVTELIQGRTVKELIAKGPVREEDLEDLADQLLRGLVGAHEQGVLHRDLKPGNLIVTRDGTLKILDFGLAKLVPLETYSASITDLGDGRRIQGTVPYMPPEVLRGEPATQRSDLYSAGVTLYEMATGRRPFTGSEIGAMVESILSGDVVHASQVNGGVSEAMSRFIGSCMKRDPTSRYPSAARALAAFRESTGASPRRRRRARRRFGSAIVLSAGIAGIAIVAATFVGSERLRSLVTAGGRSPIRSLAVLPLANLADPDQQYFADGITEALTANLAQIRGLRVISRTSAMRYRETDQLLPEIARDLRVDAVVEGSVMRSGDDVRITAQLIRAPTDEHLWAATYDRRVEDILRVQADVAGDIARHIRVRLSPEERDRLTRSRPVDPAAYEEYLKGRHLLDRRSAEGFISGIRHLERAVQKDPGHALAYAGLASGFALMGSTGYDMLPPREACARAKTAAERAVALDPELAEAQTALAQVRHNYDWSWDEAEAAFLRALELNPGSATAHQWYAFHLTSMGRLPAALNEIRLALDVDPLSPVVHTSAGRILYYLGRYDEAIGHFERAREIDPAFPPASILLGMTRVAVGATHEATVVFREGYGQSGAPVFLTGLGLVQAAEGDEEGARETLRKLAAMETTRYVPAVYRVVIHANLGETRAALEWLERAIEERSEAVLYVHLDPLFAGLREEPRFRELLESIGLGLTPGVLAAGTG